MSWGTMKAKLANMHRSITIWFNGVLGTVAVGLPMAQDNFPQLQSYVPEKWYHYMMGALVVGNIMLRFKTSKALEER